MIKHFYLLSAFLFLFCSFGMNAQTINNPKELEMVLSRALTMQPFRDLTVEQRKPYIKSLVSMEARFIGRAVSLWGNEATVQNSWYFPSVKEMVDSIHIAYRAQNLAPPIIQGAIFEIITPSVNQVQIPFYVLKQFSQVKADQNIRNFNFDSICYLGNYQKDFFGKDNATPDVSRIETQMWYYFLATKFIDAGIKAIHFGQIDLIDDNDPGYLHFYHLLSEIRAYAHGKKSFILCDAHTSNGKYYSQTAKVQADSLLKKYGLKKYTDLKTKKRIDLNEENKQLPTDSRELRLVFDFHSYPTRPDETGINNEGQKTCIINPKFGIYFKSKGGWSPFLGFYLKAPYIVEIDNGEGLVDERFPITLEWNVWGSDEISWYKNLNDGYRKQFSNEAYFAINKIDVNGFFQIPFLRGDFSLLMRGEDFIKKIWDEKELDFTMPYIKENYFLLENFQADYLIPVH